VNFNFSFSPDADVLDFRFQCGKVHDDHNRIFPDEIDALELEQTLVFPKPGS
jgi:hypothetical protein